MRRPSGMTLLELIIVMAILAAVAAIGVTNGRQAAQRQAAKGAVATFQQSVWQGATAAAARGLTVELHRTATGLALVNVANDQVLREYDVPAGVSINAPNPILRFTPPGKVDLATLDALPDSLVIDTGEGAYEVQISLIGEVKARPMWSG